MIPDENFSKEEHLLKTRDFRNVYNNGASFKRDKFVLYIMPNDLRRNRIGFALGARSIKLSTRRNSIRRLLREVYRRNKKNLRNGFDLVLAVKKDLQDPIRYNRIEDIFFRLAKEAGLVE